MASSVTFEGLDELLAALRALPSELAGEGAEIVERRADGAAAAIGAGYPRRAGNLAKGLEVKHARSPFGARSVVRNGDAAAAPFDRGTQARHTRLGANRGSMPPNQIFSRTIIRERRAMYGELKDLLARKGLEVSGDA